jgi:hypothetical protein
VVQDKDFLACCVKDLKTEYDNDRLDMDAPDKLMILGYQKFKNINLHNTWQAPTPEDKNDIITLLALNKQLIVLNTTITGLMGQLLLTKKKSGDGENDKWAWKLTTPDFKQAQTKKSM